MTSERGLNPEQGGSQKTVTTRFMEVLVAGLLMIVAAVVMYDSHRVGMGWASDGPQAGYFPFYIGLIMFFASSVIFFYNLFVRSAEGQANFVDRSSFWLVMKVLIPTAIYVSLIGVLGLYVASAIFIAFFMVWLGKYSLIKALPVALGVPIFMFWLFEIAFLIPLPKGPLEIALGF